MAEPDLLSRALDHHKSGRLEDAKALYLWILDENPDDPDALNYLGVFECQLRRFDQAEELINRSPALRPAAQSLLPWPKQSLGSAQAGRATGRTTSAGGRTFGLSSRPPHTH